jgi:short chain dehydrogenase
MRFSAAGRPRSRTRWSSNCHVRCLSELIRRSELRLELNSAQRGSGCARFGTGTVLRNCRCPDKSSALANAGRGLGKGFLDQDFADILRVLDTNITGTLYLIQTIGRKMRDRGAGRILITGSIAGFIPGAYQAVYNASKAFLDSFSFALRAELKERGVTVTCLMPGATETEFF